MSNVNVLARITTLMRETENKEVPYSEIFLGLWMAKNLSEDDFKELDALEKALGEQEANKRLVQALCASGRWKSDDDNYVERS